MTLKEIAEKANCKPARAYYLSRKLGRVPTVEELKSYSAQRGRPRSVGMNSLVFIGTINDIISQLNTLREYYGDNNSLRAVIENEIARRG